MENMLVRPVHVKAQSIDQAKGFATFIVSVFGNEDLGGDVVMPGAFKSAINEQKRLPKFAPNHDISVEKRLGKVLAWREVPEGLEIDAQFNLEKQIAKEVFSDFVFDPGGQEFSFSYDVAPGGAKIDKGVRFLTKISEVMDVGPVGLGMNPRTHLVGVKESQREADSDKSVALFVEAAKSLSPDEMAHALLSSGLDRAQIIDVLTETIREAKAAREAEEKVGATFSSHTISTFDGHLSSIEQGAAAMRQVLSVSGRQEPSESANGSGKADEPSGAKADDFPILAELTKGWKALTGQKDEEGNGK